MGELVGSAVGSRVGLVIGLVVGSNVGSELGAVVILTDIVVPKSRQDVKIGKVSEAMNSTMAKTIRPPLKWL